MVEMFTTGPARILRLNRGTLAPRAPGDVTIFSTDHSWTYDVNKSASRSRNSPFDGKTFQVDAEEKRAYDDAKYGRPSRRPYVDMILPTLVDPAMAPFSAAAAAAGLRVVSYDAVREDELLVDGVGYPVALRMPGLVNARNAAAALALIVAWGLPVAPVLSALAAEPGPPGRAESIDCGQPFEVIVDFAHTGPSLAAAVGLARGRTAPEGRVLLVTGAAGDRDPGRRVAVGRAAAATDVVWIADEDPRFEDPDVIARAIVDAKTIIGLLLAKQHLAGS